MARKKNRKKKNITTQQTPQNVDKKTTEQPKVEETQKVETPTSQKETTLDKEAIIKNVNKTIDDLKNQLERNVEDDPSKQEIEKRIDEYRNEMNKLSMELQDSKEDLIITTQKYENQIKIMNDERRKLEEKYKKEIDHVKRLEETIQEMKKEYQDHFDTLVKEKDEMKSKLHQVSTAAEEYKKLYEEMKNKYEELSKNVETKLLQFEEEKKKMKNEAENERSKLQQKIEDLQSRLNCVLEQNEELKKLKNERQVMNTQPEVIPKKENEIKVEEVPKSSNVESDMNSKKSSNVEMESDIQNSKKEINKEESQMDAITQNNEESEEKKTIIIYPNDPVYQGVNYVIEYFKDHKLENVGDSSVNPSVVFLVNSRICDTLIDMLEEGLNESVFWFTPSHYWYIFEAIIEQKDETSQSIKHLLDLADKQIKEIQTKFNVREKNKEQIFELKFRCFVFQALNSKRLSTFFEHIFKHKALLQKYYYEGAPMINESYQKHFIFCTSKLSLLKFNLELFAMLGNSVYGFDFGPSRYYSSK